MSTHLQILIKKAVQRAGPMENQDALCTDLSSMFSNFEVANSVLEDLRELSLSYGFTSVLQAVTTAGQYIHGLPCDVAPSTQKSKEASPATQPAESVGVSDGIKHVHLVFRDNSKTLLVVDSDHSINIQGTIEEFEAIVASDKTQMIGFALMALEILRLRGEAAKASPSAAPDSIECVIEDWCYPPEGTTGKLCFDYADRFKFAAALASTLPAADAAQPKLVLALPFYEKRKIIIASDELVDGERLVCVAIKGDAAQPQQLLSADEQRAILANPAAIEMLMDYRDFQQSASDSCVAETTGDAKRYDELKAMACAIVAEDPEIWPEDVRRRLGFVVPPAPQQAEAPELVHIKEAYQCLEDQHSEALLTIDRLRQELADYAADAAEVRKQASKP